ncbi:LOW QUALITY PROTEIN: hypothetical protein ACHAXR_002189 [Thalassiosira sp. AJA248-18]
MLYQTIRRPYHHAIPTSRLGTKHESLASFADAVSADRQKENKKQHDNDVPTEFSLVVILSPNAHLINDDTHGSNTGEDNASNASKGISVLLGKKLRGFGEGFYSCFGGKLEKSQGEHNQPAKGAVREVQEETGINIPLPVMEDGYVGTINFTFEDCDVNRAMRVRLYCVFVTLSHDAKYMTSSQTPNSTEDHIIDNGQNKYINGAQFPVTVHPNQIRGCDEIEPRWFHNIYEVPLDQMFADDSLWLTMLLSHYDVVGDNEPPKFMFNAWYHFHPGGTETNSIMHHFIQINTSKPPKLTFEKRLFHALHINRIHSPSIKEFKENWAMANAVRKFMKDDTRMEYVLDVAGGHGALGALFLLLVPRCHTAIVIDPAKCVSGKRGVSDAWSRFWSNDTNNSETTKKTLRYRHECLRTGLREELKCIFQQTKSTNVTVVACHACQHLTDETLQIASEFGVNVAVMPCCQKDHDGWWKGLANRLVNSSDDDNASLSIGALMDLLAAGKMMSWETGASAGVQYQVKMKLMDAAISLQNRMILCCASRCQS